MSKWLLFVCFLVIAFQMCIAISWITNSTDKARAAGKCPVDADIFRDCSKANAKEDPIPWPVEYTNQIYIYLSHQDSTEQERLIFQEVICYMQYLLVDMVEIANTKFRPIIKVKFRQKFCGIEGKAGWKGKDAAHEMWISDECMNAPAVSHLLLHVLGFPHEINHPTRDQFVHIFKPNVAEKDRIHFRKYNNSAIIGYNYRFDKDSIMHYHYDEFRDYDILPVIVPLQKGISPYDFGRAMWTKQDAAKWIISYKDVEKLKEFNSPMSRGHEAVKKGFNNASIPAGRQKSNYRGDPNDDPNRDGIQPTLVGTWQNKFSYAGCREKLKGKNTQTRN